MKGLIMTWGRGGRGEKLKEMKTKSAWKGDGPTMRQESREKWTKNEIASREEEGGGTSVEHNGTQVRRSRDGILNITESNQLGGRR